MAIQAKKKPVIKKGAGFIYNPETFAEHKVEQFHVVDEPEKLLNAIVPHSMEGMKFITFDTETHPYFNNSKALPGTVVRRWVGSGKKATPQDYPFCISVCDGTKAISIFDTPENEFRKFHALAPLFEDTSVDKVAHNEKFDEHQINNIGMKILGRRHDTVVLTKLTDENRRSYQLRDIAEKHPLGIVKFEYMLDNYKQTHKISDYRNFPRELLSEYANADVWNCFHVFASEYPILIQDELVELYNKECELMMALYDMERFGMKINQSYEQSLKDDLQKLTDDAESAIYEEAGKMFNINSAQQLYQVLMDLGVSDSWISRTDKGNPKLDKDALNRLAEVHNVDIVKKILEYRKNEKLLTTYAIGIYSQADCNFRVHGSINQTEATTGRMSITKPALQTLPKKDKRIRTAFIPEDNYELYFMDLDQIEYRLFAHYAKIPSLLEAIKNGYDVHAATAAMIFHVDLDWLLAKMQEGDSNANAMRDKGKTINFALIYGVGINHLAELLKCGTTEATELKATYFAQLPEARTFIASVHHVIKIRGFVRNYFGRRRRLASDDCYKAPNSLIQGCAADYIKSKLVNMHKYLQYHNLQTRLINIVHDEVVLEVHKDELQHVPVLRWLLSDFDNFRCPITAGCEKGLPSWGRKEAVECGFEEPADKGYLSYNPYDRR